MSVGDHVLVPSGYALITSLGRLGCTVTTSDGISDDIAWIDLVPIHAASDDKPRSGHATLQPLLSTLGEDALTEATTWLEVVQEIITGYSLGHAELAAQGEPFYPYGPCFGVSVDKRCERMASQLSHERAGDREIARRVRVGELQSSTISKSTVRNKLRAWEEWGFAGLLDGRRIRRSDNFDGIDKDFRQVIKDVVESQDGDRSTLSQREILRQARVTMKRQGVTSFQAPQRAVSQYLSWITSGRGATTRAQRSTKLRGSSGTATFEAVRPGQVVAIDATRADVLVWDATHERPFSVEILTAIDVASRVVLALRVVPKSADGIDAGLLLYDVLRPFSQLVDGTMVSQWRWSGVPGTLDLGAVEVRTELGPLADQPNSLQGEHRIPAVKPGGIRADHGSIFVGAHFRALLKDFGIDLLLSRGTRPTDNAYIERLHETFQRAYQSLPGYKGRNVTGRGRKTEHEPLCTAAELEEHLRRWVALDYHRTWHQGLILPGAPQARVTPLDMYDALLAAAGRIDVPQTPTLLYQFLPIRWGTVRHAGVEFNNLSYDARCLDEFRNVRKGKFRDKDRAMPFFHDPHDVTRVWWPDPDTDAVHEIPWRSAYLCDAPLTDKVLDHAIARIRHRGGNLTLTTDSTQQLILNELTELHTAPSTREWRATISAAARRVEASRRDHDEAQTFQATEATRMGKKSGVSQVGDAGRGPAHAHVTIHDDEWPDLEAGA